MKMFKLSADCFLVRGKMRSAVYDTTRSDIHLFPQDIYNFLQKKIYSESEIYSLLSKDEEIDYRKYLFDNEIIHEFNPRKDNFTEVDLNYYSNGVLQSSIIIINKDLNEIEKLLWVFNIIENLGCKHVLLIFSNHFINKEILDIVNKISDFCYNSLINTIEVAIHGDLNFIENFTQINKQNKRFCHLIKYSYSSRNNELINEILVSYTKKNLCIFDNQSYIQPSDIDINLNTFIEAQKYNIFYNRKIFIFSNQKVYGDLSKTIYISNVELLSEQILKENIPLQNLWNTCKDEINECKNCEFRYACPDDRIPVKINNQYTHLNSCNYNPITSEWKEYY